MGRKVGAWSWLRVLPVSIGLKGKIARQSQSESGYSIMIDLADLDFLDSESAPILKRLESDHGFEIVGTEIFLQSVINAVEGRN